MQWLVTCLLILALLTPVWAISQVVNRLRISDFSTQGLGEWESKEFSGETRYTLETIGRQSVLKAVSKGSASGLVRKVRVDLRQTPYLSWRWQTKSRLNGLDELSKQGDDYVARIYVVVSGGLFFWRTIALNYVWSSNQQKGASWPNAYAGDNAMMIAIRSNDDERNHWYKEKRNVYEDLKRYFGREVEAIDAVAIMTDTDNSLSEATSYYGDIYFSAE